MKIDPSGTSISALNLQLALDSLNTRIRNRGVSAKEVLLQRDQYTNNGLPVDDVVLSERQTDIRNRNHNASSRSKAHGEKFANSANAKVGDLVYIKNEKQKNRLRDRYIITHIEKDYADLQKLISSNFMSRQYKIPLNHIYPAIPSNAYLDWDNHERYSSDDSSADDNLNLECNNRNTVEASESHSDSDSTSSGDSANSSQQIEHANNSSTGRPQRNRKSPSWMRSGKYDMT